MNELKLLPEFKAALANYKMSTDSIETLKRTELMLLVAPTSVGRNTIIRELLKTGDYHFIVSDTTRQPRINDGVKEQNGVEYWFRSEQDVLKDIEAGAFLEAAVIHNQQVSGISMRELKAAYDEDKIAITDIEIEGVRNVMKVEASTKPIFVLPPNFEEWLKRLKHRGKMSQEEVHRRLESACLEYAAALEHPYYTFVVNDTVEDAAARIHQLAKLDITDAKAQEQGRNLAEQLYIQTKAYLKKSTTT